MIKKIIRRLLLMTGYDLRNINASWSGNQPGGSSMLAGLERMKRIGISPSTIVDVGAAQGSWTKNVLILWPDSNYQLIEPLSENLPDLYNLRDSHSNVEFHLAVAGEKVGEVGLLVSDDLDGSGVYGTQDGRNRKVPVITVDSVVQGNNILLKLDTHGYEVPILRGAAETLKNTDLLVVEVYGFRISPTCLLFHELSAYLDNLGFRLIDLVDIMRRPSDQAFWQADAFFIRKSNKIFESNSYV